MSLVSTRKRKETQNPLSTIRDKGKVRVIEKSADGLLGTAGKPHGQSNFPASRTFNNLRRGSFKLFSIFRAGRRHATPGSNDSAITSDITQRADSTEAPPTIFLETPNIPSVPLTLPNITLHQRCSSSIPITTTTGYDGESEPMLSTRRSYPTILQASRSTPGLSRQLTEKLSSVFLNNNTVIHKPKLSSPPRIQTTDFEPRLKDSPPTLQSPQTPVKDISTSPLSFPSSSNGPLSQSTAPTSLMSSGAPLSAETTHRVHNGLRPVSAGGSSPICDQNMTQRPPSVLLFPRQDAPKLLEPSIATIENAAAAKVFFESHFNQLLSRNTTPRSLRRRQMENKAFAAALTNEQRHEKKRQ
ncbi:hypothetical protein IQ07DRAFT_481246, partial [Pyrenochaeta sp. DS3sAY3a]